MTYTEKCAVFNASIQAYEDALSDYRRAQKTFCEGDCGIDVLDYAREEVVAAQVKFEAADRALNA